MAEDRGLSSLTVCGLWPRDARFSFFSARSGGGSKAFSLSGWEGLCPVGFARPYSSREKRSPPRDPRGVVRETTPSNANKRRCRAGRVRSCPLPTFSGRFRFRGEAGLPPRFGGGAGRGESKAVSLNVTWRTLQETASQSSFAASGASHRRAPSKLPRSNKPFERGSFPPRA